MQTLTDTIDQLRDEWAKRLTDVVLITRPADQGTFNDSTLKYDGGTSVTVGTYAALIRPASEEESRELIGERTSHLQALAVYVPYTTIAGAGGVQIGDEVRKQLPPTTGDVDLAERPMYVAWLGYDGYRTRLKLICTREEGTGVHADPS